MTDEQIAYARQILTGALRALETDPPSLVMARGAARAAVAMLEEGEPSAIAELAKETAPLAERLRAAELALEDMTAERDDYRDRWETLGRVARRKIERLEARLREA